MSCALATIWCEMTRGWQTAILNTDCIIYNQAGFSPPLLISCCAGVIPVFSWLCTTVSYKQPTYIKKKKKKVDFFNSILTTKFWIET